MQERKSTPILIVEMEIAVGILFCFYISSIMHCCRFIYLLLLLLNIFSTYVMGFLRDKSFMTHIISLRKLLM
jgi:hypothetical protein